MNYYENIRFQLENKMKNILSAREKNFRAEIKILYEYLNSVSLLSAICKEIESIQFNDKEYLKEERNRRFIEFPDDENSKIALCYSIMHRFINSEISVLSTYFMDLTRGNFDDRAREISRLYIVPIYQYIVEKIEESSTILYLLDKYRHRTEWFQKKRLFGLYNQDTQSGEDNLTLDLQEYLHSQGIDYPFSTPHSPTGRADIVGLIDTPDPLVLEVKLFNLHRNYGKDYIRKGFTQAYRYAIDYGKSVGYYLIFSLDERDLNFEQEPGEKLKSITIGDKTIFIIVVNLFVSNKTASQMKKPLPYIIEDSYLKNLDDSEM